MISSVSLMGGNVGDGKVGDDKVISTAMETALATPEMANMWSVKGEMWVIMVG